MFSVVFLFALGFRGCCLVDLLVEFVCLSLASKIDIVKYIQWVFAPKV